MVMSFPNDIDGIDYQERFSLFLKTINTNAKNIYDNQTRKNLIKMCEEYYDDNDKETDFIEEFSRTYKPEQAISWYMRETCLHRLLSRAFTEHDMNILVDMYSFIVDIQRNLQKQNIKQSSPLRVFRGQFLSDDRLSFLKTNINQMITMQCFFSAQISRDETLHLLQNIEPIDTNCKRILFEIDISQDYTLVENDQSSTPKTVLFMLGAVFKIVDVTETTVVLSQYTQRLNSNYDLTNESSLIIRGILTYLKDGTREAIKYFKNMLMTESSLDLALSSSIYGQLGYLQQKSDNLAAATQMYGQAMNCGTMQFNLYLYYLDQAAQYHATVLGDWEKAKTIWIQKLGIQNTFQSEEEKAQTYENLARATLETKQYDKTIEYASAAIQNLSTDHPHLPFLQEQLECAKVNLSKEI